MLEPGTFPVEPSLRPTAGLFNSFTFEVELGVLFSKVKPGSYRERESGKEANTDQSEPGFSRQSNSGSSY